MRRDIKRLKTMATQTLLALTVLTAAKGVNRFMNHTETWYNLNMKKVVQRADEHFGIRDAYAVREDGIKTYNGFVILAADKSVPYGTIIETSWGTGIFIDYHETEKDIVDIATNW